MGKSNPSASPAAESSQAFDQERQDLCLEAVWELDALAHLLPYQVSKWDDGSARFVVRGIAARIMHLTSMLMDGLGDPNVTNREIERKVMLEGPSTQG